MMSHPFWQSLQLQAITIWTGMICSGAARSRGTMAFWRQTIDPPYYFTTGSRVRSSFSKAMSIAQATQSKTIVMSATRSRTLTKAMSLNLFIGSLPLSTPQPFA